MENDGKFQKYVQSACYSGNTQDVLISVRHIAEMMKANDLKECDVVLPLGTEDATIRIRR